MRSDEVLVRPDSSTTFVFVDDGASRAEGSSPPAGSASLAAAHCVSFEVPARPRACHDPA